MFCTKLNRILVATMIAGYSVVGMAADRNDKRKKASVPQDKSKRPESKNVNELFRDARKLYDEEKYTEATVAFNRIVKKFPTHQPSLLLYARSLYRLEKLNDAYYLFSRVNPQLLDPDAAYEYGQVFYGKQQYAPALLAFQKVPGNHSFADLARYYGGICAVKLKQYEVAEDMMSKALVLPEKEAKSRSLYLKHIAKLRELKQKQALSAERVQERARLKAELDAAEKSGPATPAANAPGAAALEPAKPALPTEYTHKGFESVSKRVELGVRGATQNIQKNENAEGQASLREVFLKVAGGSILPLGSAKSEERPAIGLQLRAKGFEDRRDGSIFVETRPTTSQLVEIVRTPDKARNRIGEVTVNVFAETPIKQGLWTSLSGNYYIYAPNFERKDRTGSRAGLIKFGQMKERYSILATGSLTESFGSTSKVELTAYHADLTASYKINDEFSADFSGVYENYAYAVDTIDGADALYAAILIINHTMPLGFSLALEGDYEYLQNYIAHNMPSFTEITADGQNLKGTATLSVSPFTWLKASLYLKQFKTYWYVADPEQQKVFNINVQDYLSEYGTSISLNLFF